MHDTLGYFQRQPVHRAWHHNELTFALVYAWAENFVLPISHDEVVHGKGSLLRKMPGDRWQQLANVRAFLAYMWAHPGKQLIFMGIELGQESEWAEARELDWWLLEHSEHRGVHDLVRDLNRAYVDSPAIWSRDDEPASFQWINANDAGRNVFSFLRTADGAPDLVCVANFSATPHGDYRLGLPSTGPWDEVVNTDAAAYAGSGSATSARSRRSRATRRPARPRDPGPASARHRVVPQAGGLSARISPVDRLHLSGLPSHDKCRETKTSSRPHLRAAAVVEAVPDAPEQPTLTDGMVTLRRWRLEDVEEPWPGTTR